MYHRFIIRVSIMSMCFVGIYIYSKTSCSNAKKENYIIPISITEQNDINDSTIEKYQQQSHERAKFLKNNIKSLGYHALYNALVPEVFCKDLIRIGRVSDGGKWICNPLSMLDWPNCNIYSLGVSEDPSFEEDFQNFLRNKCEVRSVDRDDQSSGTLERIKKINGNFKRALIGNRQNKNATIFKLSDILSEFGDNRIDILKIDIEGAEFEILNEIMSTPICQILIEVHGKTPIQTYELLQTFSKNGFYLFSYEINGAFHKLCEYSFIHKNCLSLFNVKQVFGKYLIK